MHETGSIRVHHRPGSTDWTLVVFGPRQPPFDGDRWWGSALGRREGLDLIGVSTTAYDWYPRDTMAALLPAIRAAAKPAIVAYGFSMGGYAALKYASALGARGVLALSAQYSIDPADGTTGERGMTYFDPALHRDMRITPGDYPDGALLMWDPESSADDRHAAAIARLPGIRPVRLRLAGHATAAIFSETGRLVPVAEALLAGRHDEAVAGVRAARREAPTVLVAAAALLEAHGHPRWAAEAQRRAEAGPINAARAVEARARAFARLGDPIQEIAALRAWQAAMPRDFEPRLRLVERLMALGRPAEAAEAARASIAAGISDERLQAAVQEAEAAARPAQPEADATSAAAPVEREPPRLLGETRSIRLWHWPGQGPGTLVIFTPVAAEPAGPGNWWSQRLAARLGWNTIAFAAHEQSWYPGGEMATLLPLALAAMPPGPRVAYGLGMGGYAALKFGRALAAEAAVALSPVYSIDPADMPDDVRAQRRFDPQRNAGMAVRPADLSLLPIVVYDPLMRQDGAQARRLAAMYRVRAVPIRRGGQALASILGDSGRLVALLQAALRGDGDRAVSIVRAARLASPTLRATVAAALDARGHPRWAAALRKPAGALPPKPVAAPKAEVARRFSVQARALRLQRKHGAEAAVCRSWIAAEPGALEPRLNLARCLNVLGRTQEGVATLLDALRAGLRHRRLNASLVRLLLQSDPGAPALAEAEAAVAALPCDADTLALRGEIHLRAKRLPDAEAAFLAAARVQPDHLDARLGLVLAGPVPSGEAAATGPHLATLLEVLGAGPAPEADWLAVIDRLAGAEHAAAAMHVVADGLRRYPRHLGLALRRGRILLGTGDKDAAIACFSELTRAMPQDVQAWYGLTDALGMLQRHAEGRDAAAQAAALHPGDAVIAMRHAVFLLALEEGAMAEREARRAIELAPAIDAGPLVLMDVLRWQERRGDAIRLARSTLETAAGSVHVAVRLGRLLMEEHDPGAAAEAFGRATEMDNPPREAWVGFAEALEAAGRPAEAEAAARRGLAARPEARELRGILGHLLLNRGESEEARDALAEAIDEEAGSPVVSLAMADAWLRQGRRREAMQLLLVAVDAAPGHIEAELRLGQLLLDDGRYNDAARLFARVCEVAPDLPAAWVGLSDAERLCKRVKPALEAYRRAAAAGADTQALRNLRYRLFGEYDG
ncbi:tetratricopeptide repeat protein [Roseomonas sp. CAU 1739]|uniref:tetratricopeptide repeat protein n=1 Tax=Roseomonas sp. CAU 1739 TaxID=3140364 RepID=UPI00325AA68A